jgi:hypothetical protein
LTQDVEQQYETVYGRLTTWHRLVALSSILVVYHSTLSIVTSCYLDPSAQCIAVG